MLKRRYVLGLILPFCCMNISYANINNVPAVLNQEASILDVTVPVSMPINVDGRGNVTVANNLEVLNGSYGPIELKSIEIRPKNGWSLADYGKDYSNSRVNQKEIGMQIWGKDVSAEDGFLDIAPQKIKGGDKKTINYDATVSTEANAITSNVADMVITVGWYGDGEIYAKYDNTVDSNYIKVDDDFIYVGDDEYVVVPEVIQGEEITHVNNMFKGNTKIKGVVLHDNITEMRYTFEGCTNLVEIPRLPYNLNVMLDTFRDCTSLTVSPELPRKLGTIEGAFRNTGLLKAPKIPEYVDVMMSAFRDTPITEAPEIPKRVKDMRYAFRGCSNLTSFPKIPESVKQMDYAFSKCANIGGELVVPKGVTTVDKLLSDTVNPITLKYYKGCSAVENYSAPSNVTKVKI